MADLVDRILQLYGKDELRAGAGLHKSVIMSELKSWDVDMNQVRNVWHTLMGEGFVQQQGEDVVLTSRGEKRLYG